MSRRRELRRAAFVAAMGGRHARDDRADELASAIGGRTVMVTGASSGIGRQVALACGRAGADVVLVARREDELQQVADEVVAAGGRAGVHPCDLNDLGALDAMAERVLAQHGPVLTLVNNAGRSIKRPVADSLDRFHDVERVLQLNYLAPVRLIHRLLPGMLQARDGHVINALTLGVVAFPPGFAAYLGSKTAIEAYCRSMTSELADRGISTTGVLLPLVRTDMIAPTAEYARMPALTPAQGAAMITGAMIDRPTRVSTPAAAAIQSARALLPEAGVRLMRRRAYQRFI